VGSDSDAGEPAPERTWPRGVRLTTMTGAWWRVDAQDPADWSWRPFPEPRQRFDSAQGLFRSRYAARSARGAMREAFDGRGRVLEPADLQRSLVRLEGSARVLDLRRETTLDAFGLDDRVSTSRDEQTWRRCHELADQIVEHYGARCDGVVYRSRTTPQTSVNLVFFEGAGLAAHSAGRLADQPDLLSALVIGDGFVILD
jgi:hypothetical protein